MMPSRVMLLPWLLHLCGVVTTDGSAAGSSTRHLRVSSVQDEPSPPGSAVALHHLNASAAAEVVKQLNAKAVAAHAELDKQFFTCQAEEESRQDLLRVLRAEINSYQSQLAANMASRSKATAVIDKEGAHRKKMLAQLKSVREQCALQGGIVQAKIQMLQHDVEASKALTGIAASCNPQQQLPGASSSSMLASKVHLSQSHLDVRSVGGGADVESRSVADVAADDTWARVLKAGDDELRSREARQAFREATRLAAGSHCAGEESLQAPNAKATPAAPAGSSCKNEDRTGVRRCGAFSAQLALMVGRIEEQLAEAVAQQETQTETCKKKEDLTEAVIRESERKMGDAQSSVTVAQAEVQTIEAGRDLKEKERDQLVAKLNEGKKACEETKLLLQKEIDMAKYSRKAFVDAARDCEVSAWTLKPCSQTCAASGANAGTREATRTVIQPADANGMPCPPLKAQMSCGAKLCAQDCVMSAWESWAACSAPCGGGTRSRSRKEVVSPANGGRSCPGDEERIVCNVQGCHKPCVLAAWSDWGACSRACKFSAEASSGQRQRTRPVSEPALGLGNCADEADATRFTAESCNPSLCSPNATCTGSQGVLVLLDGSAAANFDAQVKLLQGVINSSAPGMSFGVIAYGILSKVVSPVTTDRAALLKALSSATAPGGTPDLAASQAVALNLLVALGTGADPSTAQVGTVLAFADTSMTLLSKAKVPSQQIRDRGVRLMMAVVNKGTAGTSTAVCSLVGRSCSSDVESATSWEDLTESPARFLSALCDTYSGPPAVSSNPLSTAR